MHKPAGLHILIWSYFFSQIESPPEIHDLELPVEARYIRIQIEPINNENDDSVTLYVELYGCHVSADVASAGRMSL